MAKKRMFSSDITSSDKFTEMPPGTQGVYFQLGMHADDDGFLSNARGIIDMIGGKEDDLRLLIMKGFIIATNDGIVVVKHWKMHNKIPPDRYKPTIHQEEYNLLSCDSKGVYYCSNDDYPIQVIDQPNPIPALETKEKKFQKKSITREKWDNAVKNGTLPRAFDYKIKNAFNGYICPVCNEIMILGDSQRKPSILHNTPLSQGGEHELNNISVICISCNNSGFNRMSHSPLNTDLVAEKWFELNGFESNFYDESDTKMGLLTNSKCVCKQTQKIEVVNAENPLNMGIFEEDDEQVCELQMGLLTNPKSDLQRKCDANATQKPICNALYSTKESAKIKGFDSNIDLGSVNTDIDIDNNKKNIYINNNNNNNNINNSYINNNKRENILDDNELKCYGEFNNVMLTNNELQKLQTQYDNWEFLIEKLSCHIASTGRNYSNHYATIKSWELRSIEDTKNKKENVQSENKRDYDFDFLENEILANNNK